MNLKGKKLRFISRFLLIVMLFTQIVVYPTVVNGAGAGTTELDADWADISSFISDLNGKYSAPPPAVVMDSFTPGMLLGNGDMGIVAGGSNEIMKYHISNNEMWANDTKIMIGNLTLEPAIIKGNVAAGRNCTFSSYYSNNVMGDSALDSNDSSNWQTNSDTNPKWLAVDLGREINITRWVVKHQGGSYNLTDFKLQSSTNGTTWTDTDPVTGNTDSLTSRNIPGTTARYWRLYITDPGSDNTARVKEFELYSDMTGGSIDPKTVYDSTQDIKNAEVISKLGMGGLTTLTFNAWTADSEDMFVVEITNPEGGAPVTLNADLWVPKKTSYPFTAGVSNGVLYVTRDGKQSPGSTDFISRVGLATKILGADFTTTSSEGNRAKGEFTIEGGSTVKIITSMMHSAGIGSTTSADTLSTNAIDRATNVTSTDVDNIKTTHRNWWKDYWLKSYVRLNDPTFDKYYYGALYAFGCASRPGEVCPGLWANFNTTDTARWGGQYTTNYNVEATYYGIFSSNRVEFAEPYVKLISTERPYMENYAAKAGYKGAASIRNLKPFNMYRTTPVPLERASIKNYQALPADQKSNGTFTAFPVLWWYEYTMDDTFLRDTAYPLVKDMAEFWADYATWDGSRYVVLHSGGNEGGDDTNPNLDVGYARSMLKEAIDLSIKLGVDADLRTHWQDVLDKFSDFATKEFNGKNCYTIAENIINTGKPWYIEMNGQPINLEGLVFPGENLAIGGDPTMIQNVINTLDYQEPWCLAASSNYNGFPKTWSVAARVGYPAADLKAKFKTAIEFKWRGNLTVSQPGGGLETVGALEGVNSMLMQSENGVIKVFPAWPTTDNAYYKRLRAKGAFLVGSKLENGTVQYVDIKSEKGTPVKVANPWGTNLAKVERIDDDGNTLGSVRYSMIGKNIVFNTAEGERYKLTQAGVNDQIDMDYQSDKTELSKAIVQASKLTIDNFFTDEEWNTFDVALKTAQELNANVEATQAEVDKAVTDLNAAISNLFYPPDKTQLNKVIDQASKLTRNNFYTDGDWSAFDAALKAAQDLNANAKVTQAAVDKAVADLNTAMKKVKQAGGKIPVVKISETTGTYTINGGHFVQIVASGTNVAWSVTGAASDVSIDPISGALYAMKEGTYTVTAKPSSGTTETISVTFTNMSPISNMTSNGNGNGIAFGPGTKYPATLAFDGSVSNFYEDNQDKVTPHVGWDFGVGNEKVVNAIRFAPRGGTNSLRANGVIFQGSNDKTNFVNLCTISGLTSVVSPQPYYIRTFNNTTSYRYYRWVSPPDKVSNVAEIQMYANVDKTSLANTVVNAKLLTKENNHTDEAWQQLQDALTSAADVISNTLIQQNDIDEAEANIQKAMDRLKAQEIAAGITAISAPIKDAVSLTFPAVPQGFSVSVKSSDKPEVIGMDGSIVPPLSDTTVSLVLTVTKTDNGAAADTTNVLVTVPAGSTAEEIAAGVTAITAPVKDAMRLKLPAIPSCFTIVVKTSDKPEVIDTSANIIPPDEETAVNLVLTVMRQLDGLTADTGNIAVVVPKGTTAGDIAAGITVVTAPAKDAARLTLPTVEGFSIAIKTSDSSTIDTNGKILPPDAETTVHLILIVTRAATGGTAETGSIEVVVPKGTTAGDIAAGITVVTAPAKDAASLTLPTVPAGFSIAIKTSDSTIIDTNGNIVPPDAEATVYLVFSVTRIATGGTGDTAGIPVVVPAASLPEEVAGRIAAIPSPAKDAVSLTLPDVLIGWTVKIKSSDKPDVIDTTGKINPPEEETIVNLILTVTRTANDGTADTISISVVVPARSKTAEDVVEGITEITAPLKDAVSLVLPSVPDGYSIAIKSSDKPEVIDTNGNIVPPIVDTTVNLVLTVTKIDSGISADTECIPVVVPARTKTAEDIAAEITAIAAPAKDSVSLILPSVPDGYSITIKSSDKTEVIDTNGNIALLDEAIEVNLVLTVTKTDSGTSVDTGSIQVIVPARSTAVDIAAGITTITAPSKDAQVLELPAVPIGFLIAIKTSSNTAIIGTNGSIVPPNAGAIVNLVFKVTRILDASTADTASIPVTVPAKTVNNDRGASGDNKPVVVPPVTSIPPIVEAEKIKVTPKLDNKTGEAATSIDATSLKKALEQAKEDEEGVKKVVIEVAKVDDAQMYSTELSKENLASESLTSKVEIKTEIASIIMPNNMLRELDAPKTQSIQISVSKSDTSVLDSRVKELIGNRPVIDINLKADGKTVAWSNQDTAVTVSIPYIPTAEELKSSEFIVVRYIDDRGNVMAIPSGRYDKAAGCVVFSTTHFSTYAVGFEHRTFSDISDFGWAKKQIEVLTSKGIIGGTSATKYTPQANITRADFLTLLVKTLGLSAKVDSNFEDVKASDYYFNAVGTAKVLGIVSGTGNGKFNPKAAITRQDMMVMIEKAMKAAKKLNVVGSSSELDRFADKSKIAGYAQKSVATMVKAGIIRGRNGCIEPKANATRAETAAVMYNIYNSVFGK